jgi:hypothetical protein
LEQHLGNSGEVVPVYEQVVRRSTPSRTCCSCRTPWPCIAVRYNLEVSGGHERLPCVVHKLCGHAN